jgi:hypothetical protein
LTAGIGQGQIVTGWGYIREAYFFLNGYRFVARFKLLNILVFSPARYIIILALRQSIFGTATRRFVGATLRHIAGASR